jgi:hypothetical protein
MATRAAWYPARHVTPSRKAQQHTDCANVGGWVGGCVRACVWLPLVRLSVPLVRLSEPLLRLSVPLVRLSVPLLRLSVPLLRLSVPLLRLSVGSRLKCYHCLEVGRVETQDLDEVSSAVQRTAHPRMPTEPSSRWGSPAPRPPSPEVSRFFVPNPLLPTIGPHVVQRFESTQLSGRPHAPSLAHALPSIGPSTLVARTHARACAAAASRAGDAAERTRR